MDRRAVEHQRARDEIRRMVRQTESELVALIAAWRGQGWVRASMADSLVDAATGQGDVVALVLTAAEGTAQEQELALLAYRLAERRAEMRELEDVRA